MAFCVAGLADQSSCLISFPTLSATLPAPTPPAGRRVARRGRCTSEETLTQAPAPQADPTHFIAHLRPDPHPAPPPKFRREYRPAHAIVPPVFFGMVKVEVEG